MPACPHYPSRHSYRQPNMGGVIAAVLQCIETISGVGTSPFTLAPSGYAPNWDGLVQIIEDLNWTMSGISAGGGGGGTTYTAGSGIYFVNSSGINVNFDEIYKYAISGFFIGTGDNTVMYSGHSVIISGTDTVTAPGGGGGASITVSGRPGVNYSGGALWFDTTEGRMFVYASGNGVSDPGWYQTNAEAIAIKSEQPPSGAGYNAPPRDGVIWFNTLMGSLFVYDANSSGWYEASAGQRNTSYGSSAPSPAVDGALWYDTGATQLKVWNGTSWTNV